MRWTILSILSVLCVAQTTFANGGPDCASSTVVTTVPFREEGVLDVNNGPSCIGEPVNDVFYSFVAPAADTYVFSLTGSTNSDSYRMRLWTDGTCCSGNSILAEFGSTDNTPVYWLALTQGQTMVIEIGVTGLEQFKPIAYTFQIIRLPTYADICPGVEITELPFSHLSFAAGLQNNVDLCGTAVSGPDEFFRVEFNETKRCLVSSCFSGDHDTIIEIVQSVDGTCFNSFNVACSDDECGSDARLTYTFLANTVYYIVLDHRTPTANYMYLLVEEDRDNCPGREIENIPFYITGNTDFSNNTFTGCEFADNHDDIYRFISESTALLDVSTCGSSFNTALQIFQSPDGSCNNLIAVACNDDFCGQQSRLQYQFVAGVTYYIVVDGVGHEEGNYNLSVTLAANDIVTFAAPIYLTTYNSRVLVSDSTLGKENDFVTCDLGSGPDVFYRLEVYPFFNYYGFKVGIQSADFDCIATVYTDATLSTRMPANNLYGDTCGYQGVMSFSLENAESPMIFYIAVDGLNGESGNFVLQVAETEFDSRMGYLIPSLPFETTSYTGSFHGLCGTGNRFDRFSVPFTGNRAIAIEVCGSPELIIGVKPPPAVEFDCSNLSNCPAGRFLYYSHGQAREVYIGGQFFPAQYTLRISYADFVCPVATVDTLPFSFPFNQYEPPGYISCGIGNGIDNTLSFTPDSSVTAEISVCDASFDAVLTVAMAPVGICSSLVELACNDDYCGTGSQLVHEFLGGVEYFIIVDQRLSIPVNTATLHIEPCAPLDLIADSLTIQPDGSNIQLNWTEANCSPLEYHVYRAALPDVPPSPANLISTTLATTYTDSNVVALPSDRHFYVVTTSLID